MLKKIWNYTDEYVKICKYFCPECFYTKHLRCVYVCAHEWCSDCNHGGSDASYQLLSGFTILLSRVSCFYSLCTPFFFGHETDASSMEIFLHRVNLIFSMLVNKEICSKQMRLVWSNVRIDFTWQVNRACIINSCPYVLGLPSTVLILWVLTRFFYDDRGYVFTVVTFIFLHFI